MKRAGAFLLSVVVLGSSAIRALAYYHPDEGRWISRDPIGESGGMGIYEHAFDNPLSRIDPLGLECTLSEGFFYAGIALSQMHKAIGPDNEFPWYRIVLFNTLNFPVNCPKCQNGEGPPTVKITAAATGSGLAFDIRNDFQVITFDPGTCDKNGSAKVSVQTRLLVKMLHVVVPENAMVKLQGNVELCYKCISCK